MPTEVAPTHPYLAKFAGDTAARITNWTAMGVIQTADDRCFICSIHDGRHLFIPDTERDKLTEAFFHDVACGIAEIGEPDSQPGGLYFYAPWPNLPVVVRASQVTLDELLATREELISTAGHTHH